MFWGCAPSPPPPAPGLPPSRVKLVQARLERFEADQKTSVTQVEEGWFDREARALQGQKVRATFETQAGPLVVAAPFGESFLAEGHAHLSGGVEITDADGRVMKTQVLDYFHREDRLESAGEVRIQGENFWLVGERLSGQPRAGLLVLEGQVRAQVRPR